MKKDDRITGENETASMKNKYQMLAGNTVKLGLGTFGSKLLVFLMVRFYTEFLSPADYGADGTAAAGAHRLHLGARPVILAPLKTKQMQLLHAETLSRCSMCFSHSITLRRTARPDTL